MHWGFASQPAHTCCPDLTAAAGRRRTPRDSGGTAAERLNASPLLFERDTVRIGAVIEDEAPDAPGCGVEDASADHGSKSAVADPKHFENRRGDTFDDPRIENQNLFERICH